MNILFVSAVLPFPLHSGGQVRIYNLLKLLSRRHAITLCAFIRDEKERMYLKNLNFCHRVETIYRGHAWQPHYLLSSAVSTYPFLFSTYKNAQMQELLERELRSTSFDIIHLEPGYVWLSVPKTSVPIVLSEHNIEYLVYQEYVRRFFLPMLRPLLYLDVLKLKYWERRTWLGAQRIVAVSDDDTSIINRSTNKTTTIVIPNGVDLSSYPFRPKMLGSKNPVFLFVGSFLWMQNRDAVKYLLESIWPEITERYPKATLRIVGKNMPRELRQWVFKRRALLLENVTQMADEFQKADILIAPIRIGGGTSFKILEAMASGVPVLTSTLGAQGLNVRHKEELLVADSKKAIVEAVGEVLTNPKLTERMRVNARRTIEKYYAWEHIADRLESVWKETYEKNH